MRPEKEKKLKNSLNSLLIDLEAEYKTMDEVVAMAGIGMPFVNYPNFSAIGGAIKILESIKSMPVDSLLFAKKLVEIEYIFKGSSTLKNYNVPDFIEVVSGEILVYAAIDREIDILEAKSKELYKREEWDAYNKSNCIVDLLRKFSKVYFIHKNMSLENYKREAMDIINSRRHELDKHRGCKQILGNLLILISTLGTAHLVKLITTGNIAFFHDTDSSKKIDKLINVIEDSTMNLPSTSAIKI